MLQLLTEWELGEGMAQRKGTSFAGEEEYHRVSSVFSSFAVFLELQSWEEMRRVRRRQVRE